MRCPEQTNKMHWTFAGFGAVTISLLCLDPNHLCWDIYYFVIYVVGLTFTERLGFDPFSHFAPIVTKLFSMDNKFKYVLFVAFDLLMVDALWIHIENLCAARRHKHFVFESEIKWKNVTLPRHAGGGLYRHVEIITYHKTAYHSNGSFKKNRVRWDICFCIHSVIFSHPYSIPLCILLLLSSSAYYYIS